MKKYILLLILLLIPFYVYADNRVINGNDYNIYKRSKDAIYNEWLTGKIDRDVEIFTSEPSYVAPYKAGVVTDAYLTEVLENLNYYRYLIGVPTITNGTTNDVELQTAEVLQTLYAEKEHALSHYLYNVFPKPDDMDQAFYNLGAYANHNIVSYGMPNEPNFFFFDESIFDDVQPQAGHRMALLSPEVIKEDYGIGQKTIYGRSTNSSDNYNRMDNAFAAYPSPGYFPAQDFADTSDWDVFFNIYQIKHLTEEEQDDVLVTITNLETGEKYTRSKALGNIVFDYDCVGTMCTIYNRMNILQPDKEQGEYYEGSYEVYIANLIDREGNPVDIKYTVNFYDKYENADLELLAAYYDLYIDTIIYDGEYDENLLDNALEGLPINMLLEDNNQYTFTPNSYQYVLQSSDSTMSRYNAYPDFSGLPGRIKDNNNILDDAYLKVYGINDSSSYRFVYDKTAFEGNTGDNLAIYVNNFFGDYEGTAYYYWVYEKDGVFYDLSDGDKYTQSGMSLGINNLEASDSGNYYLTALLTSDTYMSIYYLSKPISLSVKSNYMKGDMNQNNKIDLNDVITLLRTYLNGDASAQDIEIGDMDDSKGITLKDIIMLLRLYLQS